MAEPLEIIAAPLELYVAPVGTVPPAIDEAPAAEWIKVGTSGTKNYSDEGVTVTHEQEISTFTPAGSTAPRKAWRTGETLTIAVEVADVSVEQYAKALNDAVITTVPAAAGVAGEKSIGLLQGVEVTTFALLARGLSPEDATMQAQYEVPRVYQAADSIEVVYVNGEPAMLALEYAALEDDADGFGSLRVGTAPAS